MPRETDDCVAEETKTQQRERLLRAELGLKVEEADTISDQKAAKDD